MTHLLTTKDTLGFAAAPGGIPSPPSRPGGTPRFIRLASEALANFESLRGWGVELPLAIEEPRDLPGDRGNQEHADSAACLRAESEADVPSDSLAWLEASLADEAGAQETWAEHLLPCRQAPDGSWPNPGAGTSLLHAAREEEADFDSVELLERYLAS